MRLLLPISQIFTQMPLSTAVNLNSSPFSIKTVSQKILKLHSLKPTSFLEFPPSNLVSVRGFVSERAVFQKNRIWGRRDMTELIRSSSISCRNGDEGFKSLETESFFDGSSEFHPEIAAGGLEAILNKMSKWFVSALFVAIILSKHDGEALWIVTGSVLNAILAWILKRILNQERPIAALRPDPGMPSSHAQSIFFTAVVVSLSAVEWLGVNIISLIATGLAFIFGSYLSWLRVSQKRHTISQVLVGAVLGTSFSICWYWCWNAVVMEAYRESLWIQVAVFLGAAIFCIGFITYVIKNWLNDERSL